MFVGIDVAKAELVVSILPSVERFTVANDERGVRTLVERMRTIGPHRLLLKSRPSSSTSQNRRLPATP